MKINTKTILAIIAGVMLPVLPAFAFAPEMWVPGNGVAIYNILMAIRGIVQESNYLQLFAMIALVSFLFVAASAAFMQIKPGQVIIFFATLMVIITVSFNATMSVTVDDPVNDYTNVVDDVPLAVAFPATLTSAIGRFFLNGVEVFFSYPQSFSDGSSSLSLSRSGQFDLIGQMVHDASVIRLQNPHVRASMHAYVQDCVVPKLYTGEKDIQQLRHSTDLWDKLKNTNPAMLSTYYSDQYPHGDVQICSDVWQHIKTDIETYAPRLAGAAFNSYSMTNATSFFEGAYSDAHTYLTDSASPMSTADLLRHNAIVNSFMDTSNDVMTTMGDTSGLAYAINSAQAQAGQLTGWQMAANIFQKISGYLYTVIQAFIIAVIPFCLLAFIIPKFGMTLAGSIVKIMIWLALWQPLLGIVNFIIASYIKTGVGPILTNGVTIDNIQALSVASQHSALAASIFASSIPLLAWGLVSGGQFAMTQFLAEGAGQMYARRAATEAAGGNARAENMSFGNNQSHKEDLARSYSFGQMGIQAHRRNSITMLEHMGGEGVDVAGQRMTGSKQLSDNAQHSQTSGSNLAAGDSGSWGSRSTDSQTTRNAISRDLQGSTANRRSDSHSASGSASVGDDSKTSQSLSSGDKSGVGTRSSTGTRMWLGASNPFQNHGKTASPSQAADVTGGRAAAMAEEGASTKEITQSIESHAQEYSAAGGNPAAMRNSLKGKLGSAGGAVAGKVATALRLADFGARWEKQDSADYSNQSDTAIRRGMDSGTQVSTGTSQKASHDQGTTSQMVRAYADSLVRTGELSAGQTAAFTKEINNSIAATDTYAKTHSVGRSYNVPDAHITSRDLNRVSGQIDDDMAGISAHEQAGRDKVEGRYYDYENDIRAEQGKADGAGITPEARREMNEYLTGLDQASRRQRGLSPITDSDREIAGKLQSQSRELYDSTQKLIRAAEADGMGSKLFQHTWSTVKNDAEMLLETMTNGFSGNGFHVSDDTIRRLQHSVASTFHLPQAGVEQNLDSESVGRINDKNVRAPAQAYDTTQQLVGAADDIMRQVSHNTHARATSDDSAGGDNPLGFNDNPSAFNSPGSRDTAGDYFDYSDAPIPSQGVSAPGNGTYRSNADRIFGK